MKSLFVVLLCVGLVSSHALFSCPRPRSASSSTLKTYPCGSGELNQFNPQNGFTVLSPGPLTVTMTETINHQGAPMRFALSFNGDDGFEDNVLLDHFPHWDDSVGRPGTSGSGRPYYVNIEIPNVNCTGNNRCVLQAIQVMTDKIPASPGYCTTLTDSADPDYCFSVYHSCADIQITGSVAINDYVHTYVPPPGFDNPTPAGWYKGEGGVFEEAWFQAQTPPTIEQSEICGACAPVSMDADITTCSPALIGAGTFTGDFESSSSSSAPVMMDDDMGAGSRLGSLVPTVVLGLFVTLAFYNLM